MTDSEVFHAHAPTAIVDRVSQPAGWKGGKGLFCLKFHLNAPCIPLLIGEKLECRKNRISSMIQAEVEAKSWTD